MCKQNDDESDRAYLTRWTSLRNSCKGIPEFQAVQYFVQGCQEQTLLKHRLLRKRPQTMAHLMAIADEYATADAAMANPIRIDESRQDRHRRPSNAQEPNGNSGGRKIKPA